MAEPEIAELYRTVQARLSADARTYTPQQIDTPTPTCPGWTVKGAISHLAGNVDDILAGRLGGPPNEEQTAAQVASRVDVPLVEILDQWDEQTPAFADLIAEMEVWLAAFDLVTHDFDVRGALGDTSHRTGALIETVAGRIGAGADIGRPLRIETDTQTLGSADAAVVLRTTDFELVRVRPGRRSAAQVRAMDWSEDVGDDALRLCVFGPSPLDIAE